MSLTPRQQELVRDAAVLYGVCQKLVPILQQAGYRDSCAAGIKTNLAVIIAFPFLFVFIIIISVQMVVLILLNWILWRPTGWWREKNEGGSDLMGIVTELTIWAQSWTRPYIRVMFVLANELRPRVAERSKTTFVIPRRNFLKMGRFPVHEDAIAQNLLVERPIKRLTPSTLFASHKWHGDEADRYNSCYDNIKKYLESDDGFATSAVWFDRTCVPQQDKALQFLHLQSIPELLVNVELRVIEGGQHDYISSIWCQLEAMFSASGENLVYDTDDDLVEKSKAKNKVRGKWNTAQSFEPQVEPPSIKRNWTIYDVFDLYAVLPGFLIQVCERHTAVDFLTDKSKSLLLVGIIQVFMKHYEENSLPL